MHGYFMDARLYRKAHSVAAPYTLDKFMRDKINGKLAAEKTKRVQFKTEKLPKTNKDLFLKLKDNEESGAKKKHRSSSRHIFTNFPNTNLRIFFIKYFVMFVLIFSNTQNWRKNIFFSQIRILFSFEIKLFVKQFVVSYSENS